MPASRYRLLTDDELVAVFLEEEMGELLGMAAGGAGLAGGDRGGGAFLPDLFGGVARQHIEAAFGADLDADPDTWSWTRLAPPYVLWDPGVNISIGERNEALDIVPASLTCQLRNDQANGGDFTLDNPLSPFFPNVKENTPIRARVDVGTGVSDQFFGYLTSASPTWIIRGDRRIALVNLLANGITRRLDLGDSAPQSPMWRYNMLSYRFPTDTNSGWYAGEDQGYHAIPAHYWALEEGSGAIQGENAVNPAYPLKAAFGHLPRFGADTELLCTRSMPQFNDGTSLSVQFPLVQATGGTGESFPFVSPPCIRVQFLIRFSEATVNALKDSLGTTADAAKARLVSVEVSSAPLSRITVFVDNDPTDGLLLYLETKNSADATLDTIGGAIGLPFEQGIYCTVDILQSGPDIVATMSHLPLIIDPDTAVADAPFTASTSTTVAGAHLYGVHGLTVSGTENLSGGSVSQISIYGDNEDGSFGDRYPRALLGRSGDTVATRLYRLGIENNVIIDVVGDATDIIMGAQGVGGFMDLVKEGWRVDAGLLVDGLGPGLTYVARSEAYAIAPVVTLDMSDGDILGPLDGEHTDRGRVNDFTARNSAGSEGHFVQPDGPLGTTTVGTYDDSAEIRAGLPEDLYQAAAWRVAQGTVGGLRYPLLEIEFAKPSTSARLSQWVTNARPLSRIDVLSLAPGTQRPDLRFLLRGWSVHWNSKQFNVKAFISPYDAWSIITLLADAGDSSEFGGRLAEDDGASVLVADVAAGASSFDVVTTGDGPLWISGTTPTPDYDDDIDGLYVLVSGLKVSVTDIESAIVDTYSRSVSSSWGTATSGQPWTLWATASAYSTTGTKGRIQPATLGQLYYVTADTGASNHTIKAEVMLPLVPAGGAITMRVTGRWTDDSNYYETILSVATTGVATLTINQRVSGTGSQLATAGAVGTHSANDVWIVYLDVSEETVRARAYNFTAGGGDPGYWQAWTTDGDLLTGTQVGVGVRRETGNTDSTVNVDFDNFDVKNPQRFTVASGDVLKALTAGTQVAVFDPPIPGL